MIREESLFYSPGSGTGRKNGIQQDAYNRSPPFAKWPGHNDLFPYFVMERICFMQYRGILELLYSGEKSSGR